MSEAMISVENLGKKYVLSHQGGGGRGGYRRFSESLEQWAKTPWRWFQQSMESRKGGAKDSAIHGMAPEHRPLTHSGDASGREGSSLTRKELLEGGGKDSAIHGKLNSGVGGGWGFSYPWKVEKGGGADVGGGVLGVEGCEF